MKRNSFIWDDYDEIVENAISAAEEGDLPAGLQVDESIEYTIEDIRELLYRFHKDTGLDMTAVNFLCDQCGRMHLILEIDYCDEEDAPIQ